MKPSSRYQFKDGVHRVVHGQYEAVVHAQTVGEIFTRLGLDVEDLHRTEVLDPRDLQVLNGRGTATGQIEGSLELGLERIDEPISSAKIRRSPAFWMRRVQHP